MSRPEPVIRQAYRYALDVRPAQEAVLVSFCGAARFAFNWGLALVKDRLDRPAGGEDVPVHWSYRKVFQNESRRGQQRIAQASLTNARWISGVRS